MSNAYWNFIMANRSVNWDFKIISKNPNITMGIVYANPNMPWDYVSLSLNPNIDWNFVITQPEKKWSYSYLSENPAIRWETIEDNRHLFWNTSSISMNPNLTERIIENNIGEKWNFGALLKNTNIRLDFVKQFTTTKTRVGTGLSENPNTQWRDVLNNPCEYWHYPSLSMHPNITWDIICEYSRDTMFEENIARRYSNETNYFTGYNWQYGAAGMNPSITVNEILSNPELRELPGYYLQNPNIQWEDVATSKILSSPADILIQNCNITPEIIRANPRKFGRSLENFALNLLNKHPHYKY